MPSRQRDLERYRRLKCGTRTPTGREHAWGSEFVNGYPDTCPHCGCQTKGPFDDSRISHDVDACVQNLELSHGGANE